MSTDNDDQWAFCVMHGPHCVVVACSERKIGACYGGMIIRSGAGFLALPSRDLVTMGAIVQPGTHHGTIEDAQLRLGDHALKLSAKMVHGTSGVGAAAAAAILKPLIVGGS